MFAYNQIVCPRGKGALNREALGDIPVYLPRSRGVRHEMEEALASLVSLGVSWWIRGASARLGSSLDLARWSRLPGCRGIVVDCRDLPGLPAPSFGPSIELLRDLYGSIATSSPRIFFYGMPACLVDGDVQGVLAYPLVVGTGERVFQQPGCRNCRVSHRCPGATQGLWEHADVSLSPLEGRPVYGEEGARLPEVIP